MAKAAALRSQNYPRLENEKDRYYGFLDDSALVEHHKTIDPDRLHQIVVEAITYAKGKSSREILDIDPAVEGDALTKIHKIKGQELFKYFVKYCGDPASTAYDCLNQHYKKVAIENFRNRTIQKERMNSGWRYQHIAKDAALETERFISVSDINSVEADFNIIIKYKASDARLNIYVSIKNRSNTMGGQDWPKAIAALENAAISDKNRQGHYMCVFGIAMEKGTRNIKASSKSKIPYSMNTEVWNSDFFWPFFSNCSYEQIGKAVLDVLVQTGQASSLDTAIPDEVIEAFGDRCKALGLLDDEGNFNDAYKLVDLFCGKLK